MIGDYVIYERSTLDFDNCYSVGRRTDILSKESGILGTPILSKENGILDTDTSIPSKESMIPSKEDTAGTNLNRGEKRNIIKRISSPLEASILFGIKHEYLLGGEMLEEKGTIYAILPFVDKSLDDVPSSVNKRQALLQVCAGLGRLHQAEILHCDLSDTIVVYDGCAKIFGFDDVVLSSCNKRSIINLNNSAPELITTGIHTFATDIWSLGMLFINVIGGYFLPDDDVDAYNYIRKNIYFNLDKTLARLIPKEYSDMLPLVSSMMGDEKDRPDCVSILQSMQVGTPVSLLGTICSGEKEDGREKKEEKLPDIRKIASVACSLFADDTISVFFLACNIAHRLNRAVPQHKISVKSICTLAHNFFTHSPMDYDDDIELCMMQNKIWYQPHLYQACRTRSHVSYCIRNIIPSHDYLSILYVPEEDDSGDKDGRICDYLDDSSQ